MRFNASQIIVLAENLMEGDCHGEVDIVHATDGALLCDDLHSNLVVIERDGTIRDS